MELYKIGQICDINPKTNIDIRADEQISFVPMNAVSPDGKIDLSQTIDLNAIKNYTVFKNGDVLFAKITPCMENGKGALVDKLKNGYGAGSTEFIVLRPNQELVKPDWLYFFLSLKAFRLHCQQHMTGSAGQKRVPPKFLAYCDIPCPSLLEQERIVTRIEELFSQLDASVAELKTAKKWLKVYRQAVLKEAFEGALTGSEKLGTTLLGSYIEKPRYGTSKKCSYTQAEKSVEVYRIPNIDYTTGQVSHQDIKYSEFSDDEIAQITLKCGDILIIRSNGSVSLVGRAALIREIDTKGIFAGYLMRLRLKDKSSFIPEFLLYFLQSHQARIYIENKAKSTSGVHNINSTEISGLMVPIFQVDAQQCIVSALESRLSVCDSIEKTVDTALQQAEALRQSVLKKAFEGRF